MGGGVAGESRSSTPESGPPTLPPILTFQEQQEVCPPLCIHPTSITTRTRDETGVLPEGMAAGAMLPRLPTHPRISSEGIAAGAMLPRIPYALPGNLGASLLILRGTSAGALLPRCCYPEEC